MADQMKKGKPGFSKESFKTLPKLIGYLFKHYKFPMIIVFLCLLITSIVGACNTIFLQQTIDTVITHRGKFQYVRYCRLCR